MAAQQAFRHAKVSAKFHIMRRSVGLKVGTQVWCCGTGVDDTGIDGLHYYALIGDAQLSVLVLVAIAPGVTHIEDSAVVVG